MPQRALVAEKLSDLISALAHPKRIMIIEELRNGERDVATLSEVTRNSQSATSQQLAVLRTHGLVSARRDGHQVFYNLQDPFIADWLLDGLALIKSMAGSKEDLTKAVDLAKNLWKQKSTKSHNINKNQGRRA